MGSVAFALALLAFAFLARSASRAEERSSPGVRSADTAALAIMEKRAAA